MSTMKLFYNHIYSVEIPVFIALVYGAALSSHEVNTHTFPPLHNGKSTPVLDPQQLGVQF